MPNLQIINPTTNDRKLIPELWRSVFEETMIKDRGFIEIQNYVHNPGKEGLCIIRHTGGLGDIICLFPAINALLSKGEYMITVILPEEFRCLFAFYPEVTFKSYWDSNYMEESKSYEHFFDIYCPAGDHELETNFKPTRSRIESFAIFLKVSVGEITFRWIPEIIKKTKKVILIQFETATVAKDIPIELLKEVHTELSKKYSVYFVHHSKKIEGFNSLVTPTIKRFINLVANADLTISADSSLLHLASFLDIPALGIFGPTDGKSSIKHYKKAKAIQLKGTDQCNYPCYYSSQGKFYCKERYGDCMKSISVKKVLSLVYSLVKDTDVESI